MAGISEVIWVTGWEEFVPGLTAGHMVPDGLKRHLCLPLGSTSGSSGSSSTRGSWASLSRSFRGRGRRSMACATLPPPEVDPDRETHRADKIRH